MDQRAATPAAAEPIGQTSKTPPTAARQLFSEASRLASNDLIAPLRITSPLPRATSAIGQRSLSDDAAATEPKSGAAASTSTQPSWGSDTATDGLGSYALDVPQDIHKDGTPDPAIPEPSSLAAMWQWQGLQLQAPAQQPEVHRLSSSSSTPAAAMDGLASSSGTPLAAATPAPSGSLGPDLLLGGRSPFESLAGPVPSAVCHLTPAQQQQAAALQQLQAANQRSTAGNAPEIQQTLLQLSKMLGVNLPGSPVPGRGPEEAWAGAGPSNLGPSTSAAAPDLARHTGGASSLDPALLPLNNQGLSLITPHMAAFKQQHAAAAAAAAAAVAAASGSSTPMHLSPFNKPGMLQGEALPASGVNPLLANHTASLAAVLASEGGLGGSNMSPLIKAAHMQAGPMASHMDAAWVPEVPTQLPLAGTLGGEPCGSPSSPWANWSVDSSGEWPYSPAKGSPVRGSMQQHLQALQQKHLLADLQGRSASFSGSHCNSPCGWWSEAGEADSAAASPMHTQAGQQDFATLLGEAAALNATTWTAGGLGGVQDPTLLQGPWASAANAAAVAAAAAAAAQVHKNGNLASLEAAAAAQLLGSNPALLQASLLGAQAAQAAQAAAALGLQQQQLDAQMQALQLQLLLKQQQQEGFSPRGMLAARAGLRSMANQPSRIFKEQAAAQGLSTAGLYTSTLQQQMSLPRLNTRRGAWATVRKATPKAPVPQQVLTEEELQEKKEQRRQRYKEKIAKLRVQLAGRSPRPGLCMFGLGHMMVEERLRDWFKEFSPGEIHVDMRSGRCKGLATMTFPSVAHATAALKKFDGCDMPGLVEFQGCGAPLIVFDHGKQDKTLQAACVGVASSQPPGLGAPSFAANAGNGGGSGLGNNGAASEAAAAAGTAQAQMGALRLEPGPAEVQAGWEAAAAAAVAAALAPGAGCAAVVGAPDSTLPSA